MTETVGASFLYAPERNLQYIEFYAGIEKVIQLWNEKFKFGIYGVSSFTNGMPFNPIQFKFGISAYDKVNNNWR